MKITKDMIISDIIQMNEGLVPILMQNGLHCLGCALASGESIEEACVVHGMDCDALLQELNEFMDLQDLPKAEI